jgi:hypothetical protein
MAEDDPVISFGAYYTSKEKNKKDGRRQKEGKTPAL